MRAISRYENENVLNVTIDDFLSGINEMSPSAMRDLIIEIPKVA